METDGTPAWVAFDRTHLWHPYTSMQAPGPVYPVVAASGVHLELSDGRKLIDGMSSWWSALHGYRHPRLDRAVAGQLEKMAHVMFGGLTHEPAVRLGQSLIHLSPPPLQRVFLCDSGSVAVEVAIKMALQYFHAIGQPERRRLVSLRGAYHGDTTGCMAVCDPVNGMHNLFADYLPQHLFAERPACPFHVPFDRDALAPLARLVEEHHHTVAAVIVEPIVQGTGGMNFYHPEYLVGVRALCDEFGLLLIHDEIATGFGRTGRMFATEHAGISPDIMCVGKALTGGYMTLAATLCTEAIAEGISAGPGGGALMHGPTFMGNPLACAVANENLALLADGSWRKRVADMQGQLEAELAPLRAKPGIADVRALGAIGVVERETPVDLARAHARCGELGVWLRPFGKLVYTMPPYVATTDEVSKITQAMAALAEL
ncbi:MAG: adenosylmethionine--8-amino-7-oxononanoate transaminase [Myxococcales bacterium]|nr:adenosylmethionine--8-amino-7-oxononanoate transaminase [Myxococcales bacterium]